MLDAGQRTQKLGTIGSPHVSGHKWALADLQGKNLRDTHMGDI